MTGPNRKKSVSDFLVAWVVLLLGSGIVLAFFWNFARYGGIEYRGVETTGTITEARAPQPKSQARVSYTYVVAGKSYSGHSFVDDGYYNFARNNLDQEIPIIYFKEYPGLSAIRGFNNGKNLVAYFVAALIFFPLGLFLFVNWMRHQPKSQPTTIV
ncbi:MAG: hypothetical protein HY862_17505 [Chloroflexi bacterium]|nr:hypothetical protein [Chloroflexota bacterium]